MTQCILSCSPYFTDLALNEMRRPHQPHPQIALVDNLAPGLLLLEDPAPFDQLTAPWRTRLPIYLHHCFPVQEIIPLDGHRKDLAHLRQLVMRIAPPNAAIQVRAAEGVDLPYSEIEVQRFLNARADPGCRAPSGPVVSVVVASRQAGRCAYVGVSDASHNLSPWAGGQIPIMEPVCNRAGYKLIEAISAFSIRLRQGDHALDLGASPGAWTTLLRQRGLHVTAVAPTPMYPWLMLDDGVSYHPMIAEDYLGRCHTPFDLIVNDMKLYPQDSARLMVKYAPHLRVAGIAIMTLKLGTRHPARAMDHAFRILRKAYKIIRVRQLVSNRHEVTLFLRRKN